MVHARASFSKRDGSRLRQHPRAILKGDRESAQEAHSRASCTLEKAISVPHAPDSASLYCLSACAAAHASMPEMDQDCGTGQNMIPTLMFVSIYRMLCPPLMWRHLISDFTILSK